MTNMNVWCLNASDRVYHRVAPGGAWLPPRGPGVAHCGESVNVIELDVRGSSTGSPGTFSPNVCPACKRIQP